ncbi:MAG TPA: DUF2934 domain-containing protein [Bryobacteraceae bacterium]|nr:DUF2934 domain-containing protein [Bryobacteraceae bacterium]
MAHSATFSPASGPDQTPRIVPPDEVRAKLSELHEDIALRAYHLFEAGGRRHGHDQEDWSAAEKEFVEPLPINITEDDRSVVVTASFLRDTVGDLLISVEPWRVMAYGVLPSIAGPEHPSRRSFATVILPARVNPQKPEAAFSNGTLTVHLTKEIRPDE